MNRQIRGLALILMGCFLVLFVQVNLLQVAQTSCPGLVAVYDRSGCQQHLNNDPRNVRAITRDFSQNRGTVTSADGVVLAKSVPSNDRYKYQRVFPTGSLFGQITGSFSFTYGASGVEREYNDELSGHTATQQLRTFSDLFVARDHTGNLTLTVRDDLQATARQALGDKHGSALVLDPKTGSILAMWSNPSYDPNPLSHHDTPGNPVARLQRDALLNAPGDPLLVKPYQENYTPGSTFKLVTGSTGVQTGKVTPTNPVYPTATFYKAPVPYGAPISNFDGEACGGTLFTILAQSCNSAFAQMGTETIGPRGMVQGADSFGFDGAPPIDLPGPVAESTFRPLTASSSDPARDFTRDLPILAQSSIGQADVKASPLEMALVASGIANNGVIMAPHVLREVRDAQGNLVETYPVHPWRTPISAASAATMRDAMRQVVQSGTATIMQEPGFDVGAKTGTAEIGTPQHRSNNAWMVAWAGPVGGQPDVVVAVVVPDVPGYGNNATGAAVAGPAAHEILTKALAILHPAGGTTPSTTPAN